MTAKLTLPGDLDVGGDLAVTGAITGSLPDHDHSGDAGDGGQVAHAHLSGIATDDHHAKYTDAEAVSAVEGTVKLDDLASPDDNTDLDASTTAHGLLPKLDNDADHFLDGQGNWSEPGAGYPPAYFHAYDNAGGTTIPTSWTDVTFDTEVKKDTGYTFTAGNAEITIANAGWYMIIVDVAADVSDTSRSHADWRLTVDSGGGHAEMQGSRAATYHRTSADGRDSATITRLYQFSAGDKLKLQGLSDRTTQVTTVADACRITIYSL